jgi:uncharacterized damage-inducible protein DinB
MFMTRVQAEQLSLQLERANRRLRERLAGITDDEYLWEPVPGCWTVRRRETAISPEPEGRGVWVFDNAPEEQSPPPFTTIAWRLMHLVDVIGGYHVFLWGDGELVDNWLEVSPTAAEGISAWEDHAGRFVSALATEDDAALEGPVRIPWWPEPTPRWRVVANVATEAIHHGAEIGVLRDLYGRRTELCT